MSAEENKALARHFLEAQVHADLDTLDDLLAPDFVDYGLQPGQEPGREGFMQVVAQLYAAVSNASVLVEDQAAEGDKVISRVTMKRTHDRGEYLLDELYSFVGEGWEQGDDITLLTLKRSEFLS